MTTHTGLGRRLCCASILALFFLTLLGRAVAADQNVTGNLDVDGNTLAFGTYGTSTAGLIMSYADTGNAGTLTFALNRDDGSFLWDHSATIAAMRLTANHELVIYKSDGTTAGVTLTPATNTLSLGATTLYRDSTTGALRTNGALTADGAFSATTFTSSSGTLTGGTSGLALNAGGTDQNITLSPNGAGSIVFNGRASYSATDGVPWWLTGNGNGPGLMLLKHGTAGGSANRRGSLGWADNAGVKSEFLTWNEFGNVGIGTPGPNALLHVKGSGGTTLPFLVENPQGSSAGVVNRGAKLLWSSAGATSGLEINRELFVGVGDGATIGSSDSQSLHLLIGGSPNRIFTVRRQNTAVDGTSVNYSGSTELFRVDSTTGNVGIGTTTPGARLSVSQTDTGANPGIKTVLSLTASNDQSYAPANSGAKLLFQSAYNSGATSYSSAAIYQQSQDTAADQGGQLRFQTSNASGVLTDAATINKLGNVGIGTTSPGGKLEIKGGNNDSLVINNDGSQFTAAYWENNGTIGGGVQLDNTSNKFRIFAHGASNKLALGTQATDYLTIDTSGRVGIGTASPNAGLMVYGAGQTTSAMTTDSGNLGAAIVVNDSSADPGSGGAFIFGANNGTPRRFAAIKGLFTNGGSNGQGDIAFSIRPTATDPTLTEAMRITYDGKVGIGTPTPATGTKLDVAGNVNVGGNLAVGGTFSMANYSTTGSVGVGTLTPGNRLTVQADPGSSGLNYGQLGITPSSDDKDAFITFKTTRTATDRVWGVGAGSGEGNTNTNFRIYDFSASIDRLNIDSAGNVGIGTTTPGAKLHVAGNAKLDGIAQATGGLANNQSFMWTYRFPPFANDAAQQVAYINLPGDQYAWGWLEVTLTDTFANQNTIGRYTKRFAIGHNANTDWTNFGVDEEVVAAYGPVASQWKIGRLEVVNGKVRIPIYHLVTTGNSITVQISGMRDIADGSNEQFLAAITTTAPATVANTETRDYVYTTADRSGFGTSTPTERVEVAGNVKVSGKVTALSGRFDGPVRIAPQGDLSMGTFTTEP